MNLNDRPNQTYGDLAAQTRYQYDALEYTMKETKAKAEPREHLRWKTPYAPLDHTASYLKNFEDVIADLTRQRDEAMRRIDHYIYENNGLRKQLAEMEKAEDPLVEFRERIKNFTLVG